MYTHASNNPQHPYWQKPAWEQRTVTRMSDEALQAENKRNEDVRRMASNVSVRHIAIAAWRA